MNNDSNKAASPLAEAFAKAGPEMVIYVKTQQERDIANRIVDAISRGPESGNLNISIRSGSAPLAPGSYGH